jgi:hypothetical protein
MFTLIDNYVEEHLDAAVFMGMLLAFAGLKALSMLI